MSLLTYQLKRHTHVYTDRVYEYEGSIIQMHVFVDSIKQRKPITESFMISFCNKF